MAATLLNMSNKKKQASQKNQKLCFNLTNSLVLLCFEPRGLKMVDTLTKAVYSPLGRAATI